GLEIYWDGVPYLPLGRDSVYVDPARIPLAPLERVDVVVLPAQLRVYLVSARHESTVPTSEIRILSGEASNQGYRGAFAKRWRSGLGLSLAADWNTIDGFSSSATTAFRDVDLWLKVEYVPTPRAGASYQIPVRRITLDADARHAAYVGGRHGSALHLGAGVELPLGFSARGDVALTNDLQAPTLAADSTQNATALAGAVRWDRPWVTLEL